MNNQQEDKFSDLYRSGEEIVNSTFEEIIHSAYQRAMREDDQELIDIISKRWFEIYQVPYFESESFPVAVLGGPGQGKSTSMFEAAKKAAAFLGLNFVSNRNKPVTKHDLFFDSITLGGKLSPAPVKGFEVPSYKDYVDSEGNVVPERIMETILPENVIKSKYARTAILVLDDAPNAHPDVLTAVYDLLKPEVESDYSNAYYCLTGNTGEDGAAAKDYNTAIYDRCRQMMMKDTVREFNPRIQKKYRGDIAESMIEAIVIGFFESNPNMLNTSPKVAQREKTKFSSSRSATQATEWFAKILRPYVWISENAPERFNEALTMDLLNKFNIRAVDMLGREVGRKISQHAIRVIQEAEPIARAILKEGKVTDKILERIKVHHQTGSRVEDLEFMHALSDSLAALASARLTDALKGNDLNTYEHTLNGFFEGAFNAIPSFRNKDFVQNVSQRFFSSLIGKGDNKSFGFKQSKTGEIIINSEFFAKCVDAMAKVPAAVAPLPNDARTVGVDKLSDLVLQSAQVSTKSEDAEKRRNQEQATIEDHFKRYSNEVKDKAQTQKPAASGAVQTASQQSIDQPAKTASSATVAQKDINTPAPAQQTGQTMVASPKLAF